MKALHKNTLSGLTEMLTEKEAVQRNYVNEQVRNSSRWIVSDDDALVASIAWQIAKDEGEDGITLAILQRARKVARDQ